MMIPKAKIIRSPKHLDYIRDQECMMKVMKGYAPPSNARPEAHHLMRACGERGTGKKSGDQWAVPLDAMWHRELHDKGELEFFRSHDIHYQMVLAHVYLRWTQSPAFKEGYMEYRQWEDV